MSDEDLLEAAETLYGASAGEFRGAVLVPQAEREILMGKLYLEGEKVEDWLAKERKARFIMMLSSHFGSAYGTGTAAENPP